jgi:hypothetical protein
MVEREFHIQQGLVRLKIVSPPLIAARGADAEALAVYDQAKAALTTHLGAKPTLEEEYNYYSQHTPLGACLANRISSSGRPSCQWTAHWPDVHMEINPEGRVEIRQSSGLWDKPTRTVTDLIPPR